MSNIGSSINALHHVNGAAVSNPLMEENVLMLAQLENLKLREELKKLQESINNQSVQDVSNKRKKSVPENVANVERGISLYGRKYSLMVAPWIDNGTLNNLKGRFKVQTSKETRFASKKTWKDDVISDLYEFLPEQFHEAIENHSHATSTFTHHLQNTRSNAVLAVRTKAAVIFDLPGYYFETNFDRASVPKLQNLLKNPDSDEYAFLAPILFKGGIYNVTKKGLFLNIALPRIVKTILCGRSSTTTSTKSFSASKPQTLAELWNVTAVTAGTIAFSAVLARYMLSPDTHLRKKGPTTAIKWFEDFSFYKGLLVPDTRKTREIFKFFNDYVFGEDTIAGSHLNTGSANVEDFDDAMRAILDEEDSVCLDEDQPRDGSGSSEEDEGVEGGLGDGDILPPLNTPSRSPDMLTADLPSPGVFVTDERAGASADSSHPQDEAVGQRDEAEEDTLRAQAEAADGNCPRVPDEAAGDRPSRAPSSRAPSSRVPSSRVPSSRAPSSRAPAEAAEARLGEIVEEDANGNVQEKVVKKKKSAKARKA